MPLLQIQEVGVIGRQDYLLRLLGLPVWQSLGFLEKSSYACNCPEGPVPMDTGQLLALGKEQNNVSSVWEVSSAQGAAEQRV